MATPSAPSNVSATIITDSISPTGHRLTTMEVTMHRFVLPEFNTHRAFSRNSGSSRAIPTPKQLARVTANPAIPVEFGKNKPGMQADEIVDNAHMAYNIWLGARDSALKSAQALANIGVHKQVVNRLLEPFMWQTVIVSATDWANFFEQRCSPLAQPEIRVVAEAMQAAYTASTPQPINGGEWHLPYLTDEDAALSLEERKRVSVARCARVSYLTHDGTRDITKDLDLYERLVTADPPHWSPLEHVATPNPEDVMDTPGNFTGWTQLRHYQPTI